MRKQMYVKYIVCILLMMCGYLSLGAHTIISKTTGEPVIYASVGIVNRNLGTLTDTLGNFSLTVPPECFNDSLRISCVGFTTRTFAVKDFSNIPDTIKLDDNIIALQEVVVKPQNIKHKTAGRKGGGGFIGLDVEGYKAAGQGIAIPLEVKKRAWLKELGFTIVDNSETLSQMKFRINIYRKEDDAYILENIEPLYFDYDKKALIDGKFTYTFDEEISLEHGEYYIELEFLENFENEYFTMKTKPMTGKTRYRYASQSEWKTLSFGVPIYIEYDTIE